MYLRITAIFLLGATILFGSVAPNPFLKPGSNRKPPTPVKPVLAPKPIIRPDIAKELEFKGYFILKNQIYFSLFNKKVNHGEWIRISEKTYEEFSVQKFDLETETLTVLYEGQSFELKLLQSKSSNSLPPKSPVIPSPPKSIPGLTKSAQPRVMPPKPKSNPVIPSFLVNKPLNNRFPGSTLGSSANTGTNGSFRSMVPGLPYPGFVPRRNVSSNPGVNSSNPISNRSNNSNFGGSVSTSQPSTGSTNSVANENVNSLTEGSSTVNGSEFDLDSLPPPPPPPNILPPSPPPNLIPSRED